LIAGVFQGREPAPELHRGQAARVIRTHAAPHVIFRRHRDVSLEFCFPLGIDLAAADEAA
jgi:hypothetical protein